MSRDLKTCPTHNLTYDDVCAGCVKPNREAVELARVAEKEADEFFPEGCFYLDIDGKEPDLIYPSRKSAEDECARINTAVSRLIEEERREAYEAGRKSTIGEQYPNNRVACVSCKKSVEVTALNAIKCADCGNPCCQSTAVKVLERAAEKVENIIQTNVSGDTVIECPDEDLRDIARIIRALSARYAEGEEKV